LCGVIWNSSAWGAANRVGRPEAGIKYLREIAGMVGGALRIPTNNWPDVTGPDGHQVNVSELLKAPECEFRSNPATDSDLISAAIPI
jgi:hypothetical protein